MISCWTERDYLDHCHGDDTLVASFVDENYENLGRVLFCKNIAEDAGSFLQSFVCIETKYLTNHNSKVFSNF